MKNNSIIVMILNFLRKKSGYIVIASRNKLSCRLQKITKKTYAILCALLCISYNSFATNPNLPYIGTQSDAPYEANNKTGADAFNNGHLQNNTKLWGKDITSVIGNKLGYMTPNEEANKGGVWSGNKSSALTFGGIDKGIFVNKDYIEIKNNNLNLNLNSINNLKDGDISATSKDAINGSQLYQTNQQVNDNKAAADKAIADNKAAAD
ncbi:hypothetical protein, partial [Providencia alcalifaciens]|uniref:hypothetical protein n=1 Tax=Providencia alcalifaciens TaxID=126385 RepID=UPI000450237C